MRATAVAFIIVASMLTAWSLAAKPSYRAVIALSIGDSAVDAGQAAAMMRSRAIAGSALKHSSSVTVEPLPNTRIVEIAADDADAARAATAASTIANAYLRFAAAADREDSSREIAALEQERAVHDRALIAARERLARDRTAAAGAETLRALMTSALERQQAAHQRATDERPAFLSVVAAHAPLDASAIGDDPIIQMLQMRATVFDGGRIRMPPVEGEDGYPLTRGIDVAADMAQQDLALRARQLASAIRREYEDARTVEHAADDELDELSDAMQPADRAAADAAGVQAAIATEQAALQSIASREVAIRTSRVAVPDDEARIIDARTASRNRAAALAEMAWFGAACVMLMALLSAAIRDRTPRRHYPPGTARQLRPVSRRVLAAAESR